MQTMQPTHHPVETDSPTRRPTKQRPARVLTMQSVSPSEAPTNPPTDNRNLDPTSYPSIVSSNSLAKLPSPSPTMSLSIQPKSIPLRKLTTSVSAVPTDTTPFNPTPGSSSSPSEALSKAQTMLTRNVVVASNFGLSSTAVSFLWICITTIICISLVVCVLKCDYISQSVCAPKCDYTSIKLNNLSPMEKHVPSNI